MSIIYVNPYTFAAPTSGIITDGLQLYLDAGNTSSYPGSGTTWTDLSGNGRNGTLTNGPGFDSANGGSITFDGSNDEVILTGASSFTITASTWIVWMNRGGVDNFDGILFSRGTKTVGLNFLSGAIFSYTYEGASTAFNWDSTLIPPDNAWVMMALTTTSAGATAYMYKASGLTTGSNAFTHPSVLVDGIRVGNDSGLAGRFYQGKIAQALIYNRALTQDELTANYNVDKARYGL